MDWGSQELIASTRDHVPARVTAAVHGHNVQINGGNLTSAGRDVHHHTHFHEATASNAPSLNLISVLGPIDNFRQIQQDTLSKATPQTGEWIFEYEVFPIWRDTKSAVKAMWGSGIPGAGKTVLTSIAVNGVERWAERQGLPICVCYIYFRYSDNAGLTVRHCLEVLVKQTIEKHSDCLDLANRAYAEHVRLQTRPNEEELLELLSSFTTVVAATFYFLDALDEAPTRLQFDLLHRLSSLNVKLFITSRPLPLLEADFPHAHHFTIAAHDQDLDLHINNEIQRSPHLRHILNKADPSWRADIVSAVKEKCGGMFLHASLQMAALQECLSVHNVKDTLEQFPAQIEDVYVQTWQRIIDKPSKMGLLAQTCITWVLHATRSLSVEQAVATNPETHAFDRSRLVDKATLVAPCRGLLVVDEETRLVRLVHYTAKDALGHLILKISPYPHALLTSVCVARLIGHGFQDWKGSRWSVLSDAMERDPFLGYAYEAWHVHARNSLDDTSTTTLLGNFVRGCHAFPVREGDIYLNLLPPLHLAAFFDLPLASTGFDPTTNGDPNSTMEDGATALHVACRRNSLSAVKELLGLPRILVNAPKANGETPLMLASIYSKEATIKLLLAHRQTDVNAVGGRHGESALTRATRLVSPGIANLVLAHPLINVNVVDREGRTPLLWAARLDCRAAVKALLAHAQINVNLADKAGWRPLLWAANRDHRVVLRLLLAHSQIDVNLADKGGRTPLLWAFMAGHTSAVEILLAHPQVDVNRADKEGSTPLLWVAKGKPSLLRGTMFHSIFIQQLLSHPRTNVNRADKEGCSPLLCAVKQGNTYFLKSLLGHPQVDVNATDKHGATTLLCASFQGETDAAKLLLAHPQVDVNLADRDGQTPLMVAILYFSGPLGYFSAPLFQSILAHPQVNVNAVDKHGETALIRALRMGYIPSARLLLACTNINISLVDNYGRTALHWARVRGCEDVVDLLLDRNPKCGPSPNPSSYLPGHGRRAIRAPSHLSIQANRLNAAFTSLSHRPDRTRFCGDSQTTHASSLATARPTPVSHVSPFHDPSKHDSNSHTMDQISYNPDSNRLPISSQAPGFVPLYDVQHPEPHFPHTYIATAPLDEVPWYDLQQRLQATSRQPVSSIMPTLSAQKRPAEDPDDDAAESARACRRRLG